ncbi:hypothetical protein HPB51_023965 [Rhipicephalus microplus]|uniref:Glutamate synthase central-N domain-containing protein n=1 Tax=Rhipicephalus microplus TaxID=6941 RepID=A0A9J6DJR7_RHIMP|nr:hypothetical protein HPB51_023965 [Rhipicephalus microplus]
MWRFRRVESGELSVSGDIVPALIDEAPQAAKDALIVSDELTVPPWSMRKEALGSMGNDAALACLSLCQPLIYDYFKQLFAQTKEIDIVFSASEGGPGLLNAIRRICDEACTAAKYGYTLIVLSDRKAGKDFIPVSAAMALGAVHHHLITMRQRMKCGLIVETGEAR